MKSCKNCQQQFQIDDVDLVFYEKISPVFDGKKHLIPAPSLCPDCRYQRRLSYRNERKLYHRKCDASGADIISIYSTDKPYKVYGQKIWWSDKWDPIEYGQDFDFSRSFFEQFAELQKKVPRLSLLSVNNENSDYTNYVSHLKDCYLLFSADFNRECMYGIWVEGSRNSINNVLIDNCELTYGSFYSQQIYQGICAINSHLCRDCAFVYDCRNCSNCFMCTGLRNKQYNIRNKQYSREEYEKIIKQSDLGSYKAFSNLKNEFEEFIKTCPRLFFNRNGRIESSTGDFLTDTQNCLDCFEILRGKDCRYIQNAFNIKSSYDCSYVNNELGYENCECVPMPYNSAFNVNTYSGQSLFYTDTCMNNCANLFGCIGLKHKQFCILNKQYTKEAFGKLMLTIIEHMRKTGEWGEFFPMSLSPFAYNETVAQESFILNEEEARQRGLSWKPEDKREYKKQSYTMPDNIKDVPDAAIKEILECGVCSKNYKILEQELKFCKQMNIPIERKCVDCRLNDLLQFRSQRKLWRRTCAKCSAAIQTTYAPSRPETVYCEKCYLETIY